MPPQYGPLPAVGLLAPGDVGLELVALELELVRSATSRRRRSRRCRAARRRRRPGRAGCGARSSASSGRRPTRWAGAVSDARRHDVARPCGRGRRGRRPARERRRARTRCPATVPSPALTTTAPMLCSPRSATRSRTVASGEMVTTLSPLTCRTSLMRMASSESVSMRVAAGIPTVVVSARLSTPPSGAQADLRRWPRDRPMAGVCASAARRRRGRPLVDRRRRHRMDHRRPAARRRRRPGHCSALLGVGTWLVLAAILWRETGLVRVQTAVVVVFATRGRVHLLAAARASTCIASTTCPAYVPPGHGLVYLAALAIGRTAFVRAHIRAVHGRGARGGRWLCGLRLVLSPTASTCSARSGSCAWSASCAGGRRAGCTSAPPSWSRTSRSSAPALGTWAWQPHDPTGLVSIGNPPSGAAGGYGWFDLAALLLAPTITAGFARATAVVTRSSARAERAPSHSAAARDCSAGRCRCALRSCTLPPSAPPPASGRLTPMNARACSCSRPLVASALPLFGPGRRRRGR